tara:strand:+ start:125 stop:727 length:603 start_codon:yes stop_codon:yes gene_type:complete
MSMKVGVLALQGGFAEHAVAVRSLGVDVIEVRLSKQLDEIDGLIIPGGESTTITKLMRLYKIDKAIAEFGGAIFGTCAGMIVLAREADDGIPGQLQLGLIDIVIKRNGYGRQIASFEEDVVLAGGSIVRGVFIRAPKILSLGEGVEEIGHLGDDPVLVRQGRVLAASFHPELSGDSSIHASFLSLVEDCRGASVASSTGS